METIELMESSLTNLHPVDVGGRASKQLSGFEILEDIMLSYHANHELCQDIKDIFDIYTDEVDDDNLDSHYEVIDEEELQFKKTPGNEREVSGGFGQLAGKPPPKKVIRLRI